MVECVVVVVMLMLPLSLRVMMMLRIMIIVLSFVLTMITMMTTMLMSMPSVNTLNLDSASCLLKMCLYWLVSEQLKKAVNDNKLRSSIVK